MVLFNGIQFKSKVSNNYNYECIRSDISMMSTLDYDDVKRFDRTRSGLSNAPLHNE